MEEVSEPEPFPGEVIIKSGSGPSDRSNLLQVMSPSESAPPESEKLTQGILLNSGDTKEDRKSVV